MRSSLFFTLLLGKQSVTQFLFLKEHILTALSKGGVALSLGSLFFFELQTAYFVV